MEGIRIKVVFEKYITWILINIVFSLLPIIVTMLINNNNVQSLFSSYLCFLYAILVLSFYSYYCLNNPTEELYFDIYFFITILATIILIVFYPIYNLIENVSSITNSKLYLVCPMSIVIITSWAIVLNKKSIDGLVDNKMNKIRAKKEKEQAEEAERMKRKLSGEVPE